MSEGGLIVIGGAAGGVRALRALVAGLPPDLGATVMVHLGSARDARSCLPDLLGRAGPLPVEMAARGLRCRPGRIVVVPSQSRLVLDAGGTFVAGPARRGRGALDALLRSAAVARGPRVIGVVLSGARDDGVAGLHAVSARGGLVIAQDPRDACVPAMPCAVLRGVDVDYVAPAASLGALLARLVREDVRPLAREGLALGPLAHPVVRRR